jgi:ABC-2 type transport system permease protein
MEKFTMKQVLSITRKELDSYFGSPMALIFVGIFLVTVLFSFFWVSGFFARGIADVRPLFQWMPLLLIFLIATLTMRQWSEEQQTGTLEMLLTMPIRLTQLVIGKFLAVLALVIVGLLLTLSLPITVKLLGNLDLGPVIGGYLAAILMASAYIAIGLFVSSRTDNQIVSLLLTAIVCGVFYLVGSPTLTGLANTNTGEFLRALGTGSRFESIERGVIDLRDLVYYGSLTLAFLTLNVLSLDSKRWSKGARTRNYRLNRRLTTALLIVNVIVFNVLLARVGTVRADLTQSGEYTLSPVTLDLLGSLQEPLLVRGYFSQDNHPLLAPLIPRIRDMLAEYKVAAKGKLQLDFVDPIKNPDLEREANQTYGIRPTPLQVNDRGKTSVVNAYLNILLRYGDQNVTLSLLDMIDVRDMGGTTVDIRLRNLEYDLTSSIQRVVYGFQSLDSVFAALGQPAQLTLFVTPGTLPEALKKTPGTIASVADKIGKQANGRFVFKTVDVSDPKSGVDPQLLQSKYQIQPVAASFQSKDRFYLHMLVEAAGKTEVIYPSGDMNETQIQTSVEAALKRMSPGALHTVGFWIPARTAPPGPGQQSSSIQQYETLRGMIEKNFQLRAVKLLTGHVPNEVDALVIINGENMNDRERYAVDQFLMRGGSVLVAAGYYQMSVTPDGALGVQAVPNGLQDVLASYGITIEPKLVRDTQNAPFPVPVQRNVGGTVVNEIRAVNYPDFVDVRSNGMDQDSPVAARLSAVTLNWVSPISVDPNRTKGQKVTTLFRSTANSWATTNTNVQPNFSLYPDTGFPVDGERKAYPLAVLVEGSFSSYFNGRPSPFATPQVLTPTGPQPTPAQQPSNLTAESGFLSKSPDTARLIVVGSSEFLNDTIFNLSRQLGTDQSASSIQLIQNTVEWFVEDAALSTIRAKGAQTRLLSPISDVEKSRWEAGNYIFALLSLIGLGVVWQLRKRSEKPIELVPSAKPAEAGRVRPSRARQGGS